MATSNSNAQEQEDYDINNITKPSKTTYYYLITLGVLIAIISFVMWKSAKKSKESFE